VLVTVTSVTTRRVGVSAEVMELVRDVVKLQEACAPHGALLPTSDEWTGEAAQRAGDRRLEELKLGEQREQLLAVFTTMNEDDSGARALHGSQTVVRRFPEVIEDAVSEFVGQNDVLWAPEALRSTLLDQKEDYLKLQRGPEGDELQERESSHINDEARPHRLRGFSVLRICDVVRSRSVTWYEKLLFSALLVQARRAAPLAPSLAPSLTPSLTPPLAPSLTPSLAPSLAPSLTPSLAHDGARFDTARAVRGAHDHGRRHHRRR
jgi:hypothetical protein